MSEVMLSTDARNAYRTHLVLTTALAGGLLIATPAGAQSVPYGNFGAAKSVSAGVHVSASGGTLSVAADRSGIIEWASFGIAAGETANFTNSSGNAINILNRVSGVAATNILGELKSDGNVGVYIINPNGIIFGGDARVNVGSLVASTLNVTDSDFLDGDDTLSFSSALNPNGPDGDLEGLRQRPRGIQVGPNVIMEADGTVSPGDQSMGKLVLIGSSVDNQGVLTSTNASGEVVLIAAHDVTTTMGKDGSPIKMIIKKGTHLAGGIVANGTILGRNVTLVMAADARVTDALLSVGGSITAQTAAVTDRGIMLIAGADSRDYIESSSNATQRKGSVEIRPEFSWGKGLTYNRSDIKLLHDAILVSSGPQGQSTGDIEIGAYGKIDFTESRSQPFYGSGDITLWTHNFPDSGIDLSRLSAIRGSLNNIAVNPYSLSIKAWSSSLDTGALDLVANERVDLYSYRDMNFRAINSSLVNVLTNGALTGHTIRIDGHKYVCNRCKCRQWISPCLGGG